MNEVKPIGKRMHNLFIYIYGSSLYYRMQPVLLFTFLPSASVRSRHWKKKKDLSPSAWKSSWAFSNTDDFSFNVISLISINGSISTDATGTFLLRFLGGDSISAFESPTTLAGSLWMVPLGGRIWACAIRACALDNLLTYARSVNLKILVSSSPSSFFVNNVNELSSRHIPSRSGSYWIMVLLKYHKKDIRIYLLSCRILLVYCCQTYLAVSSPTSAPSPFFSK